MAPDSQTGRRLAARSTRTCHTGRPRNALVGPEYGPEFVLQRRESGDGAHEGLRFALGIRTHSPPLMIKMAAALRLARYRRPRILEMPAEI